MVEVHRQGRSTAQLRAKNLMELAGLGRFPRSAAHSVLPTRTLLLPVKPICIWGHNSVYLSRGHQIPTQPAGSALWVSSSSTMMHFCMFYFRIAPKAQETKNLRSDFKESGNMGAFAKHSI